MDPESPPPYILPNYLRFARSLALVSGVAIGIAAGTALVTTASGCTFGSCAGICGVAPPIGDAQISGGPDGSADMHPEHPFPGGGPPPAPALPRAWLV
jgi:hypothetical protein